MSNKKMFLLDDGVIIIHTADGKKISFSSVEQFNAFFPEIDLSGKEYVDYEPDRGVYFDSAVNDTDNLAQTPGVMPVDFYEEIITAAGERSEEIADPYALLDLDAALTLKKNEILEKYHGEFLGKWSLLEVLDALIGADAGKNKQAVTADLAAAVIGMTGSLAAAVGADTVADVKEVK